MLGPVLRQFDNLTDLDRVVDLWNLCLPRDAISREIFRQKVLLDENLDQRGCLVAELDGQLIGFILVVLRKFPYGSRGREPDRGWLSTIFVHPSHRRHGLGTDLLDQALSYLKAEGRRICTMGYSPYYVIPGPDEVTYPEAVAFFRARGFGVVGDATAMVGDLATITAPAELARVRQSLEADGFRFQPYDDRYTLPLLAFAERTASGGWPISLRLTLSRGNPYEEVVLCAHGPDVVGYAQSRSPLYDPPTGVPERFGPFAVAPALRGKGIGSVLFFMILDRLRAKGLQHVWLGWAHGENVRFYERCGLRVTRRHLLMTRPL